MLYNVFRYNYYYKNYIILQLMQYAYKIESEIDKRPYNFFYLMVHVV